MKKQTKGAIAAGAAGILLMGGAGTLALWSDSEVIGGGTIASGELTIAPSGTPAWADVSDITPGAIADISTFKIVPGDILTYTADYKIAATGDNLKATLTADSAAITGDTDLKGKITTELTMTGAGSGGPGTYNLTSADGGKTIKVVVKITFDKTTPDQVAQNQKIDLSGFKLTLQQVRP
ncbi:MAG: alternate-type signal peptide domain-containing protein [Mycobacteriaceae bacterium]